MRLRTHRTPPALVAYDLLVFAKSYCAECRRYGEPVNAHGLAREFHVYDQGRHDWAFYLHHAGRLCAVWLANEDRMIRAAYRRLVASGKTVASG